MIEVKQKFENRLNLRIYNLLLPMYLPYPYLCSGVMIELRYLLIPMFYSKYPGFVPKLVFNWPKRHKKGEDNTALTLFSSLLVVAHFAMVMVSRLDLIESLTFFVNESKCTRLTLFGVPPLSFNPETVSPPEFCRDCEELPVVAG